jgi:3'(2'), 5'-bisphosphate nucleotidase
LTPSPPASPSASEPGRPPSASPSASEPGRPPSASPSASDAALAASVAAAAGEALLAARGRVSGPEADRLSNELILSRLAEERPDDAVLSEESADSPARLSSPRVWIVDPLDGTREYSMAGRSDWAVHVALWSAAADPPGLVAAAVAQPALGAVYSTAGPFPGPAGRFPEPAGPFPGPAGPFPEPAGPAGRFPEPAGPLGRLGSGRGTLVLVSESRPPAFAAAVAADVGGTVATMGSAGAKAMAVLRGEADAYLHAGGQWEWDSAAPVGVALAAGLHASRIDGSPLVYNQEHPYLPDLVICRASLAAGILGSLRRRLG